jgi:hypothetical protein
MKTFLSFVVIIWAALFTKPVFGQCPEAYFLHFEHQVDLNAFYTNHPDCVDFSGGIQVSSYITDLSPLMNLRSIKGGFDIQGTLLTSLNGLQNLKSVGGIGFTQNSLLFSLQGLENLEEITESGLYISHNPLLSSLEGLSNSLKKIEGSLSIKTNHELSSLEGLRGLKVLEGGLDISDNPKLTSLDGLNSLDSIGSRMLETTLYGGDFSISGNGSLKGLQGVNKLKFIGGNLYISYNPEIKTLSGLENVQRIYYGLSVFGNHSLQDLPLIQLKSIGTAIDISFNDSLRTLRGLETLEEIGTYIRETGSINITDNPQLIDISGIRNIKPDLVSNLYIRENPLLSFCRYRSICGKINSIGITGRVVSGNKGDCLDLEVLRPVCQDLCPDVLSVSSPLNDYVGDGVLQQAANRILATNKIEGLSIISYGAPVIELNPGFKVESGAVFTAQIGGCE